MRGASVFFFQNGECRAEEFQEFFLFTRVGDDKAEAEAVFSASWVDDADVGPIDGPEAPASRWFEDAVDLGDGLPEVDRIQVADFGADHIAEWVIGRQVIVHKMDCVQDHDRSAARIDGCFDLLMPLVDRDLITTVPERSRSYTAHERQHSRSLRKLSSWWCPRK